eukprot:TRINITY_DN25767_c0_g1_i5.p1 TRINITY_DN25767_c0_g1~~TRINITY_DN25767_c0_g1_i5.p1  ORF type:complete len:1418 (+),score=339.23 TRINITY_DN25767_c0_g1_i5:151-4404(+)
MAGTVGGLHCDIGLSPTAADVRRVLHTVASADAVLLLLPLLLLTGGDVSSIESCGWTPHYFFNVCALSICSLWFSLLVVGSQLVMLGICPGHHERLARRLWRHVVVPLIGTVIGGTLGIAALLGLGTSSALNLPALSASRQSGTCNRTLHWLLAAFVGAAYVFGGYYAVLLSRPRDKAAFDEETGQTPLLDSLTPVVTADECSAGTKLAEVPVMLPKPRQAFLPVCPEEAPPPLPAAMLSVALPLDEDDAHPPTSEASSAPDQVRVIDLVGGTSNGNASGNEVTSLPGAWVTCEDIDSVNDAPSGGSDKSRPQYSISKDSTSDQDAPSPERPADRKLLTGGSAASSSKSRKGSLAVAGRTHSRNGSSPSSASEANFASSLEDAVARACVGAGAGRLHPPTRKKEGGSSKTSSNYGSRTGSRGGSRRGSDLDKVGRLMAPTNTHVDAVEGLVAEKNRLDNLFAQRRASFTPLLHEKETAEANNNASDTSQPAAARRSILKSKEAGAEMNKRVSFHNVKIVEEPVLTEEKSGDSDDSESSFGSSSSESSEGAKVSCAPEKPAAKRGVKKQGLTAKSRRASVSANLAEIDDEDDSSSKPEVSSSETMRLGDRSHVPHFRNNNPINFETLQKGGDKSSDDEEDSSGYSTEEESSDDEVWDPGTQITVPVWLLERIKNEKKNEETAKEDTSDDDSEEESSDEEPDSPKGTLGAAAATGLPRSSLAMPRSSLKPAVSKPAASADDCKNKRISFFDQATGGSLVEYQHFRADEKRAEEEEENGLSMKNLKKLAKKGDTSKAAGHMTVPASFWKIPMPTRKNTILMNHGVDEEDEEDDLHDTGGPSVDRTGSEKEKDKAKEKEKETEDVPAQPADEKDKDADKENEVVPPPPEPQETKKERRRVEGRRRSQRRSVLGVFSDDNAKGPGLYALPKKNNGEVVEVRRSSIVMSSSMLGHILECKVDQERYTDIAQDLKNSRNNEAEEIILPFFSTQMKDSFRQCQCKKDDFGYVIHTCMTPAATLAENTGVTQSYVCSAWMTRRNSREKIDKVLSPEKQDKQDDEEDDDEEQDETAETEKKPKPLQTRSPPEAPKPPKRIRNASVLALVGKAGPSARKQDPEAPAEQEPKALDGSGPDDLEESEENELLVSYRAIKDRGPRPREATATHPASHDGKDKAVELELGHRFEMVEPWTLAQWLDDVETREQVLCVDVRGRDWVGGHIRSSINLRTSEVTSNPGLLLLQCRTNRIHHIVFTCMYSVLRARKCAMAVEKAQQAELETGSAQYRVRISLLAGGIHAWTNHFVGQQGTVKVAKHRERKYPHTDGFDPDCWCDGGPSQGGLVHVMDALWSQGGQKALSDALTADNLARSSRMCDYPSSRKSKTGAAKFVGLPIGYVGHAVRRWHRCVVEKTQRGRQECWCSSTGL